VRPEMPPAPVEKQDGAKTPRPADDRPVARDTRRAVGRLIERDPDSALAVVRRWLQSRG